MTRHADIPTLKQHAAHVRATLVRMSHRARAPHLGSGLSCVDILTALYGRQLRVTPQTARDGNRDRLILSKGHAAAALYATLNRFGFIDDAALQTFNANGSTLPEQPGPPCTSGAPLGVEWATGSLGHGLPVGIGMAAATRIQRRGYRVHVVLGDGECNEGSVWEAAMLAPALKLDNLVVIVDYNRWQATGRSEDVLALAPLSKKFEAFGWQTHDVDGHDMAWLVETLDRTKPRSGPVAIVAHTVKGRGVSFMEDDNNWHYRIPTSEEVDAARMELTATEEYR